MSGNKLPSPKQIAAAMTPAGGWTRATLAQWGVAWPPPKGWRRDLEKRWRHAQRSNRAARDAIERQLLSNP